MRPLLGLLAMLPATELAADVIRMPEQTVGEFRLIWAEQSEDGLYKAVTRRIIAERRTYYAHALNCEGWTVAQLAEGTDYFGVKTAAVAADLAEVQFRFLDPEQPDDVVEPLVEYVCSNIDNDLLVVDGSDAGVGEGYRMVLAEPEGEDRARYVAFGNVEGREPLYLTWEIDCRARLRAGGAEGGTAEEALSRAAQAAAIAPRLWVPIAIEDEDEYLWHLAAHACRRVYGVEFPAHGERARQ